MNIFTESIENIRLIRRYELMQKELIQALAYIRNILILGKGRSVSAEFLMEELADICTVLKPAFQDMGHRMRLCDKAGAEEVLYRYFETELSRDLGKFLAGWEELPASELLGTLEIYISGMRDDARGKRAKRDELISDIVYFPVVLNAMLVLLDFIFVAYFIEQQSMFRQLF